MPARSYYNSNITATATTDTRYTLTYNKGELGTEVFNFPTKEAANEFLHKINPPDLFVQSAYLDDPEGLRHITYNPFFSLAAFEYALREKRWEDGYYRRTGRQWKDRNSEALPGDEKLDHAACLRLLGLLPGFTHDELRKAYRLAIQLNHPDKVAPLADEFKVLAERRTRMINEAYARLLAMVSKAA